MAFDYISAAMAYMMQRAGFHLWNASVFQRVRLLHSCIVILQSLRRYQEWNIAVRVFYVNVACTAGSACMLYVPSISLFLFDLSNNMR